MKHKRGFTLIELIVAVSILSILMGVAAPSLRDLFMNAAVTGQANDLLSSLAVARSEAIKRGVRTGVCTSTNGTSCTSSQWNEGWLVFIDADMDGNKDAGTTSLRTQAAIEAQNTFTSTGHGTNGSGGRYIEYSPSGTLIGTLSTVTFTLCDTRTVATVGAAAANLKGRRITISSTGRPRIERLTCA